MLGWIIFASILRNSPKNVGKYRLLIGLKILMAFYMNAIIADKSCIKHANETASLFLNIIQNPFLIFKYHETDLDFN